MRALVDDIQPYYSAPTPLTRLTMRAIKWEGYEEVKEYLRAHDVLLEDKGDYFQLTFPEGTLESRKLPVARSDYRRLQLPGGTIIDTVYAYGAVMIGIDRDVLEAFQKQR